jgi:predicted membrane protein
MVPFLGIWAPVIMLAPESAARGAIDIPVIITLFVAMQAVICDYYLNRISRLERVSLAASCLFLFAFLILNSFLLLGIGAAIFLLIIGCYMLLFHRGRQGVRWSLH